MSEHVGFYTSRSLGTLEELRAVGAAKAGASPLPPAPALEARPATHLVLLKALFEDMGVSFKVFPGLDGITDVAVTHHDGIPVFVFSFDPDGSLHQYG